MFASASLFALASFLLCPGYAHVQTPEPQAVFYDTYGEVGLLDMPSAHMAPDGEMSFIVGDVGYAQRYNFTFQRKSWLEGTFRYSHLSTVPGAYDRSASLKLRLLEEDELQPDLAVGIRNLIGTGQNDAEYVVASKHIGPLDLTVGLGWGRLATADGFSSPLGAILPSYKTRASNGGGFGGQLRFGEYFHGPTGVYGGATWQTPINGLSLLAEYSSDKYVNESAIGDIKVRSPVNIGLNYRPASFISLTGGWFYGSKYGFSVTINGNAADTYPSAVRLGPAIPAPALRTETQQEGALRMMLQVRNEQISATLPGKLWIHVPTPAERTKQEVLQALLGVGRDVRDVDIRGHELIIDARTHGDHQVQCASLARLASTDDGKITTIALSDLQDPSGKVTFCPVGLKVVENAPKRVSVSPPRSELESSLQKKLEVDLTAQSLQLDAISLGPTELWVFYENYQYRLESQAIRRVVRVLMADAPPSVEVFHIVATNLGVPAREITVTRSAMERIFMSSSGLEGVGKALSIGGAPLEFPAFQNGVSRIYPYFTWAIDPKLAERVFDPDQPLQFMIYGDAVGLLQLAPGLMLFTELTGTIWTNYTFTRGAGSELPHVRTDILKYQKQGRYGISSLMLAYRARLTPEVFTEVKAGYLEDMYMGMGGQILWRPENSRFSFGADLYQVWKRDFNRLFGTQSYNVATGHISFYYDSPWSGQNFAVHVGRYLAGDYGVTFETTRRFSTGIEIGAWASFTNVPFRKFGEGSFDKGIIIHIPLEWALPIFSQSAYDLHLSSLTRDGGQRLSGDDTLYEATRRTSYGDILESIDAVAEP